MMLLEQRLVEDDVSNNNACLNTESDQENSPNNEERRIYGEGIPHLASSSEVYHAALKGNASLDNVLTSFDNATPTQLSIPRASCSEPEINKMARLQSSAKRFEASVAPVQRPLKRGKYIVRESAGRKIQGDTPIKTMGDNNRKDNTARCTVCDESRPEVSSIPNKQSFAESESAGLYQNPLSRSSSRSSIPILSRAR